MIMHDFKVGDRVRLSLCARVRNISPIKIGSEATVVGKSRDPRLVLIRWDGNKHVASYHHSFLDRVYSVAPPPGWELYTLQVRPEADCKKARLGLSGLFLWGCTRFWGALMQLRNQFVRCRFGGISADLTRLRYESARLIWVVRL